MTKLLPALLLMAFCARAQNTERRFDTPDPKTALAHMSPVMAAPVPCGGSANMQSADLACQPILVKKYVEIEHDGPDQEYIDSVKAAKLVLKQEYERNHPVKENKTTTVTPVVGAHFAGNTYGGFYPLDNSMAISNGGKIVSVTNSKIEFYSTAGALTYTNAITSFLPPSFGASAVCDPVVLYDPGADRFIFFCQQTPLVSGGKIYISFSKTNDPAAGWWCYQLAGDPSGGSDAFDYPKLGVNDSEVFLTGNEYFEPSGSFDKAIIMQMNKLAGIAGGSMSYVYYPTIPGTPFTLLPLSWGQGADVSTGMVMVSTLSGGGSTINLYSIVGNWCCMPTMSYWSVATTPYSVPANAAQMGTTTLLDVGNCKALSGMYLNGIGHFVFNSDNGGGYTGINYNRLTLSTLTNVSSMFGASGSDYAYPAVASYASTSTDASVMIGCGRSGSSIYPEIRVVNCDNSMSWSSATLVKSSASYVGTGATYRWGDYTGMSRHHTATTPIVWMSGSFGNASNDWDTWIAQIGNSMITTGVNEAVNTVSAKVFPNPVQGSTFTVEFSLSDNVNVNIAVMDVSGKVVKDLYAGKANAGDNIFSFNKANLSAGVYVLTIRSGSQEIKNEKIVIAD